MIKSDHFFNLNESMMTEFGELNTEESIQKFVEKINKDREELELFWDSSICERMTEDFIKINESLNDEFFIYFPEKVKETYNWNDLADKDIRKFFQAMSDTYIGLDENEELKIDKSCRFENYNFTKRGIAVFVMHGQGTSITLKPEIK